MPAIRETKRRQGSLSNGRVVFHLQKQNTKVKLPMHNCICEKLTSIHPDIVGFGIVVMLVVNPNYDHDKTQFQGYRSSHQEHPMKPTGPYQQVARPFLTSFHGRRCPFAIPSSPPPAGMDTLSWLSIAHRCGVVHSFRCLHLPCPPYLTVKGVTINPILRSTVRVKSTTVQPFGFLCNWRIPRRIKTCILLLGNFAWKYKTKRQCKL